MWLCKSRRWTRCSTRSCAICGAPHGLQGLPLWLGPRSTRQLGAASKEQRGSQQNFAESHRCLRTLHGCLLGKALRNNKPPTNTTGILITWIQGGRSYAVQEQKSDRHIKMKKITTHPREDVCLLYLYYYNQHMAEERNDLPVRPTSTRSSTSLQQFNAPKVLAAWELRMCRRSEMDEKLAQRFCLRRRNFRRWSMSGRTSSSSRTATLLPGTRTWRSWT